MRVEECARLFFSVLGPRLVVFHPETGDTRSMPGNIEIMMDSRINDQRDCTPSRRACTATSRHSVTPRHRRGPGSAPRRVPREVRELDQSTGGGRAASEQ
jgi:hypothetical protein